MVALTSHCLHIDAITLFSQIINLLFVSFACLQRFGPSTKFMSPSVFSAVVALSLLIVACDATFSVNVTVFGEFDCVLFLHSVVWVISLFLFGACFSSRYLLVSFLSSRVILIAMLCSEQQLRQQAEPGRVCDPEQQLPHFPFAQHHRHRFAQNPLPIFLGLCLLDALYAVFCCFLRRDMCMCVSYFLPSVQRIGTARAAQVRLCCRTSPTPRATDASTQERRRTRSPSTARYALVVLFRESNAHV